MRKKLLSCGLCVGMLISLLAGCGAAENGSKTAKTPADDGKIVIGMTLYSLKNEFTVRIANAAEAKAKELGIEIKIYDGNYDPNTQISQVETMIADGIDGIILNPQDAEACSPIVDKAVAAGIPIVGVNTRVKNDSLTSYVGSQDVIGGEMQMQAIADLLGGAGNIVILEGPMGQSAQLERREGIQNILNQYPDIKVLAEKTANWSRSEGMTVMENWLQAFDNIDAIVAENDEMALGAREAVKAAGKDILAIGIDGITDALTAVEEGSLIATIFQDGAGQGAKAVEVLYQAIQGNKVEANYWIDFEKVTKENVAEFKNRAQ